MKKMTRMSELTEEETVLFEKLREEVKLIFFEIIDSYDLEALKTLNYQIRAIDFKRKK
jgi:hypothetical protein